MFCLATFEFTCIVGLVFRLYGALGELDAARVANAKLGRKVIAVERLDSSRR